MPDYHLAVATSADGFIARAPDHAPQEWASAEEQALFFAHVEAADWAIMGRRTHEAADKPQRRRIILSSSGGAGQWRRPSQLWLDPKGITPADLPGLVADVRPLDRGLILGGTRVHDWFHAHGAIDRVFLTVEPVVFGAGLPVFTGQTGRDAVALFTERGYRVLSEEVLNAAGTRYLTLKPEAR